jgi:hypothetical protein
MGEPVIAVTDGGVLGGAGHLVVPTLLLGNAHAHPRRDDSARRINHQQVIEVRP